MIVVEAGTRDDRSFDAKILFAAQLSNYGYSVVIDEDTLPEKFERSQKYEISRYLADISEIQISGVIVIGAENIADEVLMTLRSYDLQSGVDVFATGRFEDHQAMVGATSKIAFAIGKEAHVVDLGALQKKPILDTSVTPLAASGSGSRKFAREIPELFIFLPPDWLEDPLNLPMLGAMDHLNGFNLNVVIAGSGKEQIRRSKFASLSVYGLAELSPLTLANIADLAVFFGDSVPGERMASFAMNLIGSGGAVIDCTLSASFISSGAPALRGPLDLAALANYLQKSVLQNLKSIGQQAANSDWIRNNSMLLLVSEMGLPQPEKPSKAQIRPARTVFMATNGNGLGHAQRSSLVASAMQQRENVSFAAFPSCVNLINDKGFSCIPLVQKSESHPEDFANDLVNYLRLKRNLNSGDSLVFDGGYVFDSIYRTILENDLFATWIRRGLWRPGQLNSVAFNREKIFKNVIVPNEAFDELNKAYTFGSNVHPVGPIVQQLTMTNDEKSGLRTKVSEEFGRNFDELVVTMLGGGVAVDRSAQMQTLSAFLERRPNCLHLVVVWPGSKISTGLAGWKNTRVVKTRNALALSQCADLVVSAAGYNSFHEILYHAIPSILIPQTAPFMDDQEQRARAASDRGLSATVLGNELLLLERELTSFLDGGKGEELRVVLANEQLPATGNTAAAQIIERGASNA